jgi:predicted TIM-barrel enzyme/DNA-binding NtrC family response regulator
VTPAERVRLRLRDASAGRGFLVGAAIGTGLAAQAATRGGADFLLALNAGRIRSMGEPSAASLLALRATNSFVPEFAVAEIRARTHVPVFVGAAAFDPELDLERYLGAIAAAGFEGITNFPTVVLLEGQYRRFLEASGYGFARELSLLAAARERGLATLCYAHTREEARRASAAGVDIINIDLGWNTGGALGVSTRMRIEEAADLAQSIVQMVRRRAPGTFCVIEGGPIVSPEQADAVCRTTDIDGYIGGSTIDRVPLETAMELVTSAFKTVGALRRKVSALERQLAPQRWPAGLIGAAPSVLRAQAALERALAGDLPVLIRGEPGSGRRDLARALHQASARRRQRLGWIAHASGQAQVEAELFGCEAGAIAGATRRRIGWLELSCGSTLVLDGIEHLERGLQLRLCAALESGAFHRIGGGEQLPLDARLIGITSVAGSSRLQAQFIDRLGAVCIDIPALREHPDDLPQVIEHMRDALAAGKGRRPVALHPASFRILLAHTWPGNLRELSAVLERAIALADGDTITPDHLPPLRANGDEMRGERPNERDWILDGLRRNRFRRGETARFLGISRKTLYNKMLVLGLLVPGASPRPEMRQE